jgi:signal transduction histidine kinase
MGAVSATDLAPRIARPLAEGTGAELAVVWLRVGDELRPAASWPPGREDAPAVSLPGGDLPHLPAERAVAVRHRGELLGALSVDKSPGDPVTQTEERLLENVASQAGLALRNVRLVEELRASRQRLVRTQDEQRRKLERNLHDGAQQQLGALTMKARLVEDVLERDPDRARRLLQDIRHESEESLEALRDLARGIFPPLLADGGLTAALTAQARKSPLPVEVKADGVTRFPQEVEAAAYFGSLEALQNAAKYSRASRVELVLSASDGWLRFEVRDDGRGFDPKATPRGTGLQNIEDRVEAIGGSLEVVSAPGSGTVLRAGSRSRRDSSAGGGDAPTRPPSGLRIRRRRADRACSRDDVPRSGGRSTLDVRDGPRFRRARAVCFRLRSTRPDAAQGRVT